MARNSGARKIRSLALSGLDQRQREPAPASLSASQPSAGNSASGEAPAGARPQGTNSAKPMQA